MERPSDRIWMNASEEILSSIGILIRSEGGIHNYTQLWILLQSNER